MKNTRYSTLLILLSFLFGCEAVTNMNDSGVHSFNGHTISSAELSTHIEQIRQERPKRSAEMHFYRISENVPGFGGFYIDEQGQYVIVLTADAPPGIAISFAAREIRRQKHDVEESSIIIKEGKYTFDELALWRELISAFVLANDNFDFVLSSYVDEEKNRVIIGVEENRFSETNITKVKDYLVSELEISLEVVSFEKTTPIVPAFVNNFSTLSGSLSSHNRPLVGGLEILREVSGICTMGFVALLDGYNVFVTNSHCTNSKFSTGTTTFFQGWSAVENIVGTEYKDPNTSWCGVFQPFWNCRKSDAAAIKILDNVDHARGFVARTLFKNNSGGDGSRTINESKPVFSIAKSDDYIAKGTTVSKVGRTTGWTEGKITKTCKDVHVSGGAWILKCQYGTDYYAEGGDSGSPVFRIIYDVNGNEHASLYGVHFGSSSVTRYFSPMSGIRSDLGNLFPNDPNSDYVAPPPFNGGGGDVVEDPCVDNPINCHEP